MDVLALLQQVPFRLVCIVGLVGTVAAIGFHYLIFGPHRLAPGEVRAPKDVRRFSPWERLIHFVTVASFVTLGVTGLWPVLTEGSRLTGWLWLVHGFVAPLFALGVTLIVAMWAKDGCFAWHDIEWGRYMGGYVGFGKDKHLPAGRFNAGQKALFWFVAFFGLMAMMSGAGRMTPFFDGRGQEWLYQLHRYSTLALVLGIISHAYLGTLANPGTIQVVITGRVSEPWAKHHHPVWWHDIETADEK